MDDARTGEPWLPDQCRPPCSAAQLPQAGMTSAWQEGYYRCELWIPFAATAPAG